jgi:hypothetical protein
VKLIKVGNDNDARGRRSRRTDESEDGHGEIMVGAASRDSPDPTNHAGVRMKLYIVRKAEQRKSFKQNQRAKTQEALRS